MPTSTASAAHETPAKTTRTVPFEFKDTATGEHFDVVQDGDLTLDPGESWETRTTAREESTKAVCVGPPLVLP